MTTIHHPSCPARAADSAPTGQLAKRASLLCVGCQDLADAQAMGFGEAWTPSQLPGRTEDQMVLDVFHHAAVAREGYAGGKP